MRATLRLFVITFFGNRKRRLLNRYPVTSYLVTGCRGLRTSLNWSHQVVGDEAYKTLDAIPACRVAIRVKLLFSLYVVGIECIILVSITIIDLGVRDTHQFYHLQASSGLRFWAVGVSAWGVLTIAGI